MEGRESSRRDGVDLGGEEERDGYPAGEKRKGKQSSVSGRVGASRYPLSTEVDVRDLQGWDDSVKEEEDDLRREKPRSDASFLSRSRSNNAV